MASLSRWYQNSTWTHLVRGSGSAGSDGVEKIVAYVSANSFSVSYSQAGDQAYAEELFAVGRLITVTSDSIITPCFVESTLWNVGTTSIVVTVNCLANTAGTPAKELHDGSIDNDSGISFHTPFDSGTGNYTTKDRSLTGPGVLSGGGSTTLRDARFPSAPDQDGVIFVDTTTDVVYSTKGGNWVTIGSVSAWADEGGSLTIDSPSGNPEILLKEGTARAGTIYHDLANNRSVVESGATAWSTSGGVKGRIYINDSDGKLFHQTKTDETEATALSLTPGPGNGLDADTVDGLHGDSLQNVELISLLMTGTAGTAVNEVLQEQNGALWLDNDTSELLVQWGWTERFASGADFYNPVQEKIYTFPHAYSAAPFILFNWAYDQPVYTEGSTLAPVVKFEEPTGSGGTMNPSGAGERLYWVTATQLTLRIRIVSTLAASDVYFNSTPWIAIGSPAT